MGFLRLGGGDGTGVEDRSPAEIAPQEFVGDVERLARATRSSACHRGFG